MARGSTVREFVGKLRTEFIAANFLNDDTEYFGYTIYHAFERAVNDALLGNGSEQKPVAKPRKKRGPNKPKPPAGEQVQP